MAKLLKDAADDLKRLNRAQAKPGKPKAASPPADHKPLDWEQSDVAMDGLYSFSAWVDEETKYEISPVSFRNEPHAYAVELTRGSKVLKTIVDHAESLDKKQAAERHYAAARKSS